jgi:DNA-binding transcriptional LysR family regulator
VETRCEVVALPPIPAELTMDRLTAMQTFLTVVDTGSFSSAARRLNVGQPAVSKTIAQLEGRLGVKLLVRSTRGLAPTEAGLNFYERARRSVEEADEADLAARGAGAGLSGKLRVCAAVTFARLHVVPRLPEFLAQNPELEIDIVLDDRNIDLVEEGIDVALRMGPMSDSSLTARKIGTSPRAVMGSAAYQKIPQTDYSGRTGCPPGRRLPAHKHDRCLGIPAGRLRGLGHGQKPSAHHGGGRCPCCDRCRRWPYHRVGMDV